MDNQLLINELNAIRARVDRLLHEVEAHQPKPIPGWRLGGNAVGTSLQAYVGASYKDLVALLGEPSESDGFKVSGEWTLTHEATGQCVTLYDYKETNLYEDDYPTVAEFRAKPQHNWHIGASNKHVATAFALDLLKALGARTEG